MAAMLTEWLGVIYLTPSSAGGAAVAATWELIRAHEAANQPLPADLALWKERSGVVAGGEAVAAIWERIRAHEAANQPLPADLALWKERSGPAASAANWERTSSSQAKENMANILSAQPHLLRLVATGVDCQPVRLVRLDQRQKEQQEQQQQLMMRAVPWMNMAGGFGGALGQQSLSQIQRQIQPQSLSQIQPQIQQQSLSQIQLQIPPRSSFRCMWCASIFTTSSMARRHGGAFHPERFEGSKRYSPAYYCIKSD